MIQLSTRRQFEGSQPYRMIADDYIRLIMAGGFGDAHVELVDGELVEMAPSGSDHGRFLIDVGAALHNVYRKRGYCLFSDTIVRLNADTVRAPDISVALDTAADSTNLSSSEIILVVEISQSTQIEDLGRKRIDYATAEIPHYWVVDVAAKQVHVFANPQGADYDNLSVVPFGGEVMLPELNETLTITF